MAVLFWFSFVATIVLLLLPKQQYYRVKGIYKGYYGSLLSFNSCPLSKPSAPQVYKVMGGLSTQLTPQCGGATGSFKYSEQFYNTTCSGCALRQAILLSLMLRKTYRSRSVGYVQRKNTL